jgi:hypothetical protein
MVYDADMTRQKLSSWSRWFARNLSGVILCGGMTACGATVVSAGVGVGNVGQSLSVYADGAAHTAEVCALQDALAPQTGGVEKPMTDTCRKQQKNDLMWRRAMLALSLYGERLSAAASGSDPETSGKLEAAMTGVGGADWSDADDQISRDAVTQLVGLLSAPPAGTKVDLSKIVLDASPPVKTLCASLGTHFDAELQALASIRKDVDKKSVSRAIRRCGTYETHSICVADTVVDRMVYAEVFSRVVALENTTYDAKDSLLRFCAAHDKLAEAAQSGQIGKKETYAAVVDAAKAVPRNQPAWESADGAKATEPTKSQTPAKK